MIPSHRELNKGIKALCSLTLLVNSIHNNTVKHMFVTFYKIIP